MSVSDKSNIDDIYPLIKLLADGQFRSGDELGAVLGITRAAVWKKIQKINESQLVCHAVRGKGYRLSVPIELLDESYLYELISSILSDHSIALDLHARVGSTNDVALARAGDGAPSAYVCIAEQQTAGRGRQGRAWVSPFAKNIYLSMLWRFPEGAASLEGLSLAVGVAVARALRHYGVMGVGLKWPNDVLVGEKKIAGILLEMTGDASGECAVVIGVGLNLDMPEKFAASISQPWTDVQKSAGKVERNIIAGILLAEIYKAVDEFQQSGFQYLRPHWEALDVFAGREVALLIGDKKIEGVAAGITQRGEFRLKKEGVMQVFSGGEVSVRPLR